MIVGVIIKITKWVTSLSYNLLIILFSIVIFLLISGCFVEPVVTTLIIDQPLVAIAENLRIEMVHFGLGVILTLMIGLLTPPYGEVLFVTAKISGLRFNEMVKTILLFTFFDPTFHYLNFNYDFSRADNIFT